ncbi:hypothetical protein [Flavobacterium piscis]|uniref:Uncharacterized protein n=1 Tax=Flavobacterium piscis TaxID=1114874 RepID=A0ABU1Y5M7_9FLAO|nr:hypothetical protein [Flavobacterium piscis]MDR7209526.1 hypothetical protein [Flavobacterium piscis]
MKKSIATIALFTLALVTTSFTTVENSNSLSSMKSVAQDPPIGGVCAGCGNKKLDVYKSETTSNANSAQISSFSSDTQSLGNVKKMD